MTFMLIVVQTRRTAEEINARLAHPVGHFAARAVFVGEALCGIHFRGQRPNMIITQYDPQSMRDLKWEREVLKPAVAQDAVWLNKGGFDK
ncbi:hypothetical protein [Paenibacillus hexagrammi]|uniref:Uncharacterized protein n=1 Tax=Paenibacillus hexagrammi TaxID=2908839 RepID=A0ABY3SSJ1_9BACL|nr:hypothetical protein [Paenibacillus sp. YPD9-1]UJF36545.1 hypothetical protein L0M14_30625 [Paenibacillus sp. YPD9-1]